MGERLNRVTPTWICTAGLRAKTEGSECKQDQSDKRQPKKHTPGWKRKMFVSISHARFPAVDQETQGVDDESAKSVPAVPVMGVTGEKSDAPQAMEHEESDSLSKEPETLLHSVYTPFLDFSVLKNRKVQGRDVEKQKNRLNLLLPRSLLFLPPPLA